MRTYYFISRPIRINFSKWSIALLIFSSMSLVKLVVRSLRPFTSSLLNSVTISWMLLNIFFKSGLYPILSKSLRSCIDTSCQSKAVSIFIITLYYSMVFMSTSSSLRSILRSVYCSANFFQSARILFLTVNGNAT